jgi:hypothetical protein
MNTQAFVAIHEAYKKNMHMLSIDLSFWSHFINQWAIPEYQQQFGNKLMQSTSYGVYDHSPLSSMALLKTAHDIHEIHSQDLPAHSSTFFSWLHNHAHVRAYNALEILILETINCAYLNSAFDVHVGRSGVNAITSKVAELWPDSKKDRNNNNQLIYCLRANCPDFEAWLKQLVRIDVKTTWKGFFELASKLRHCVTHQAMIVHYKMANEIKAQNNSDLFYRHFDLVVAGKATYELKPIQLNFDNWLEYYKEFGITILKLVTEQSYLNFLGLS